MVKLLQTVLIVMVLATGAMASTSIQAGRCIVLPDDTTGELEIQAGHTLNLQEQEGCPAAISMGTGTKLTVAGEITVQAGCSGTIESTAKSEDEKPQIVLIPQLSEGTKVTKDNSDLNETYKAIIDSNTDEWTVYETGGGYIDPAVSYSPGEDSFDITYTPIEIMASNDIGADVIIYDLDKNGGNAKFVVKSDSSGWFSQHFCTTGNGYPELTLESIPLDSHPVLRYMTNGKVIVKNESENSRFTSFPKCDVDFTNDSAVLTLGVDSEIPAGKTWRVTGKAGLIIDAGSITVKGKLVL